MKAFPIKRISLLSNAAQVVNWTGIDFYPVLNTMTIGTPIAIGFAVTNNTSQVCYLGVSYATLNRTYNLADRTTLAGVPAGKTIDISPKSTPPFQNLDKDIVAISVSLISQASGSVDIGLLVYDQNEVAQSIPQVGQDSRTVKDTVYVPFTSDFTIAANSTLSDTHTIYTVTSGKRSDIIMVSITLYGVYLANTAAFRLTRAANQGIAGWFWLQPLGYTEIVQELALDYTSSILGGELVTLTGMPVLIQVTVTGYALEYL